MTRILQASLGGNSKTAIICTMTQTLSNHQETINTLHFGQKAKHVKTKVNVNEISQLNSSNQSQELERANSVISELRDKLKQMENSLRVQPVPSSEAPIEETKGAATNQNDVVMQEGPNETSQISVSAISKIAQQTQEISNQAMRDQIKFMTDKIAKANQELETKEMLI